jgi:hypothetical protein
MASEEANAVIVLTNGTPIETAQALDAIEEKLGAITDRQALIKVIDTDGRDHRINVDHIVQIHGFSS